MMAAPSMQTARVINSLNKVERRNSLSAGKESFERLRRSFYRRAKDNGARGNLEMVEHGEPQSVFRQSPYTTHLALQDEVLAIRERLKTGHRFLISPSSKFAIWWDTFVLVALVFTAMLTPYEVAFLQSSFNNLFIVDRCIDLIFFFDICVNFVLIYRESTAKGGRIVKDPRRIAKHYLTGWFTVDLVSVLQFDTMAVLTDSTDGSVSKLKGLRIVRLLRLLKLTRMLRASRIFRRWESSISISYSALGLMKFALIMLTTGHWAACVWGLFPAIEDTTSVTWVTVWAQKGLDNGVLTSDVSDGGDYSCKTEDKNGVFWEDCFAPHELYLACLHWSVMTVTSIGFGDITPVNTNEYGICVLMMCLGSSIWAYIIGNACGILANLDPHTMEFRKDMDELNYKMKDCNLDRSFRRKVREFFHFQKEVTRERSTKRLLDIMSPHVACEFSFQCNQTLSQSKAYFIMKCPKPFIIEISRCLRILAFSPQERVGEPWTMYIMRKGVAAKSGKILLQGEVWGEDMILDTIKLITREVAICLTHIQVFSLHRGTLDSVKARYPKSIPIIRKTQIRMAVRRAFIHVAKRRKKLSSFHSGATRKDSSLSAIDGGDIRIDVDHGNGKNNEDGTDDDTGAKEASSFELAAGESQVDDGVTLKKITEALLREDSDSDDSTASEQFQESEEEKSDEEPDRQTPGFMRGSSRRGSEMGLGFFLSNSIVGNSLHKQHHKAQADVHVQRNTLAQLRHREAVVSDNPLTVGLRSQIEVLEKKVGELVEANRLQERYLQQILENSKK